MTAIHIVIFSLQNDIHALAIQKALRDHGVTCDVVETNTLCGRGNLTWSTESYSRIRPSISTNSGQPLNVKALDLIWLRRINYDQIVPDGIVGAIENQIINNDCRIAMLGLLDTEFQGTYINQPFVTRRAENKLIQLRAAQEAGFRIPRTLVSQDPAHIRSFCNMLRNNVIVKTVHGTSTHPLYTIRLTDEMLECEEAIRLCPAIYQEYIHGDQHVRAHCFGDDIICVRISSSEVDWRRNLDVPFTLYHPSEQLVARLRVVLNHLGLKMGIVDLKIENDCPVWLEINPQGQFLFAQGLAGVDLTSAFSKFLIREAARGRDSRK